MPISVPLPMLCVMVHACATVPTITVMWLMDPMLVLTVCNHCKLLCITAQDFILFVLQKGICHVKNAFEINGSNWSETKCNQNNYV